MIWLVGIGALAMGMVIGVLVSSHLNARPAHVRELENRIQQLTESNAEYRESVSDHFSMTAELVQHMTESYRDVYQHLASGAQDLCSTDVASKLLPTEPDAVLDAAAGAAEEPGAVVPPRDYAAKQSPDQKGALAEDFGIDKTKPVNGDGAPLPQSQEKQAVSDTPTPSGKDKPKKS